MAESDLDTLLANLKIKRHDGVWRFETISNDKASWSDLITLRTVGHIAMLFREDEGLTIVTHIDDATADDNRWVWLELSVFSDLQAVGFLAAVSGALTDAGVPCNAVAAYHHDHIFVPEGKADLAISALEALSSNA
ncbi:MAG: ACT domain-containing protein [Pseudomonadota bacterium]